MARGYPDGEGDKSGLYLKPEWAAKEGTDKNFYAGELNQAWHDTAGVSYLVPAGKTLYITDLSFTSKANLAANADLNQICWAYILNSTDTLTIATIGGNGGGMITFAKPAVIPAGKTVWFVVKNEANHACDIYITALGYEV